MKRRGRIDEMSPGSAPVPIAVKPIFQTRVNQNADGEEK
jgi:hypothetical protein